MTKRRLPKAVDVHVGGRLKTKRMMKGLSQEKIGDAVGLTFQQIQKYEKGTNRIGASRLQQFADCLGVPVSYFFDGQQRGSDEPINGNGEVLSQPALNAFLSTRDGMKLVASYCNIKSPKTRRAVVAFVTEAAG